MAKKKDTLNLKERLIPMALEVYKNDIKIKYTIWDDSKKGQGGTRKEVTELSRKSLANLVFLVQNTDVMFHTMITLTYPSEYPSDGKTIKSHLNAFFVWARRHIDMGEYVWFLEFQKRGAPHFHILCQGGGDWRDKEAISKQWYEIVGSGDVNHLKAGTRTEKIRDFDGAGKYAAKYGAKKEQKTVPAQFADVGRFWGASRGVKPVARQTIEVHDMQVIHDTLEGLGWEYSHLLGECGLGTLYNAGKLINEVAE